MDCFGQIVDSPEAMTKWRFILGFWIALGFFQSPRNDDSNLITDSPQNRPNSTQNTHSKLLSGIV